MPSTLTSAQTSLTPTSSWLVAQVTHQHQLALAAKVKNPNHRLRSIKDAIRWDILDILFIVLIPLPLFLISLLLLKLLRNGDNFRTVEEGASHTIIQYPAPPPPPPPSTPQFGWCSELTRAVDWCRHWFHATALRIVYSPPRRGNGPTDYLREMFGSQVLRRRMEGGSGCLRRIWRLMNGWKFVCYFFIACCVKNQMGSECSVSVRVHSVLDRVQASLSNKSSEWLD